MDHKKVFGEVLQRIRKHRDLTQEDFSTISSRTYMSSLERGKYSPTLEKLDQISSVLGVHPVTVLAACYVDPHTAGEAEDLIKRIQRELSEIGARR